MPLGSKMPEGGDPMDYLWITHQNPAGTGLQAAIKVAADAKKTPLIIDTSPNKVVDTFYMYQNTTILVHPALPPGSLLIRCFRLWLGLLGCAL